jgi:hypothetical protein
MQVMDAFKSVKANGGSSGVDKVSIDQVSENLRKYLYPCGTEWQVAVIFPKLSAKH